VAAEGAINPVRAAWAIAPGVLLAGVAGGIAFPILPLAGTRAGLPLWLIGVILAANRFTRLGSSPVVGSITDRVGARRTLIAGLLLQIPVMALYWAGIVQGHPGLFFLLGRMLHGPASACVFVGAQTLALHAGGREHGGSAVSVVRAAMSAGMPVGLAAGGLLAGTLGDAATFEVALLAVALGALVAWLRLPDLRAPVSSSDQVGAWRMLLDRRLLAVGALNFAMFFSAQGVVLTTIVLVVHHRGLHVAGLGDQGTAGLAMGWMVLIGAITMAPAGRLGDRFRAHAQIAAVGIVFMVPGLWVIAHEGSLLTLAVGIGLIGVGMGALGPSTLALVADVVEPDRRGRAVGALQLCGDAGGTLGPILGSILMAHGTGVPYLVAGAVILCVLPVALWLAGIERRVTSGLRGPPRR
jgi:MFS family permease